MTEIDKQQVKPEIQNDSQKPMRLVKLILNGIIIVLILVIGYFGYGYLAHEKAKPPEEKIETKHSRVLQIDVLNGCGVKGVASRFTDHLRAEGFDVVENKNYKSFQIPQTLVLDRIGDLSAARRIATVLGVKDKNIIQQINPDYFVDVSVIIGKDFSELHLSH